MRRLFFYSLILCLCSSCQMFEYLRPHNLWKLNREPAMGGEDAYFSIPAEPVISYGSPHDLPSTDAIATPQGWE